MASGGGYRKRQPVAVQSLTNPGAGNDFSWTVPSTLYGSVPGGIWIRTVTGLFTASVTVANRIPRLYVLVGGFVFAAGKAGVAIPASTSSERISWNAGSDSGQGPNNDQILSFPIDCIVPYGAVIESVTVGLQAGDTWTSVTIGYELVC